MSYRGPNTQRISNQIRGNQFEHAGQTAVWRQFISASSGNPAAGIGPMPFYREQMITALFKSTVGLTITQPEFQTPAGMTLDADFLVVTRQQLGRRDELRWQGTAWRIDSDSQPSRIDGTFINVLRRGN